MKISKLSWFLSCPGDLFGFFVFRNWLILSVTVSFVCVCDFLQKSNGLLKTDLPSSPMMDWSRSEAPWFLVASGLLMYDFIIHFYFSSDSFLVISRLHCMYLFCTLQQLSFVKKSRSQNLFGTLQ
jgi:hypothetical protein